MAVQFQHILAGKGMRRGKIEGDAFIENAAIAGVEPAQGRMTGFGEIAINCFDHSNA